jgi:uncharacterized membrane protein (DUF4010 family)
MPALSSISETDLFFRFGIALVIGILIGMEREHSVSAESDLRYAGVRTFALIALTGCAGGLASHIMNSPWPMAAIFLVVGGLNTVAYLSAAQRGRIGGTTEVAAILTLLLGSLCYWGYLTVAVAIAVATTLLLSLKLELHRFVQVLSREDVYAALKLAVISAIILPVLPNQTYGPPPFDVLNPYRIWLMVVFISGISFAGYVLMQVINPRSGIALTGLLGGLVSSTAVTLSFSQRSKGQAAFTRAFAMAITVAWAIMYIRILVQVAVVNTSLLPSLWLPMLAPTVAAGLYAGWLYLRQRNVEADRVELANPFELRPALIFGAIYAVTLLLTRAAEIYLGQAGLYITGLIAGIADVNAITLTMAELSSRQGGPAPLVAVNTIVLAAVSNTIAKTGIVLWFGASSLRRAILPSSLIILAVSLGAVFLLSSMS